MTTAEREAESLVALPTRLETDTLTQGNLTGIGQVGSIAFAPVPGVQVGINLNLALVNQQNIATNVGSFNFHL
jgi:hypothetical protein